MDGGQSVGGRGWLTTATGETGGTTVLSDSPTFINKLQSY